MLRGKEKAGFECALCQREFDNYLERELNEHQSVCPFCRVILDGFIREIPGSPADDDATFEQMGFQVSRY